MIGQDRTGQLPNGGKAWFSAGRASSSARHGFRLLGLATN